MGGSEFDYGVLREGLKNPKIVFRNLGLLRFTRFKKKIRVDHVQILGKGKSSGHDFQWRFSPTAHKQSH